MIRLLSIILLITIIFSCQNPESQQTANGGTLQTVSVADFDQKRMSLPDAQIVDVRTPGEFAQGHLANAVNINVNTPDFITKINELDKNKPVLLYCLSGARSKRAARQLQQLGFQEIYDLQGGLIKWLNAGKALSAAVGNAKGMSKIDFNKLINNEKYVLVDYNAKWCEPCKKMLPMLKSLAAEQQDQLSLVQIDADEHRALIQEKGIEAVPYLELYKSGQLIWQHTGYIDEKTLRRETKL